MTNTIKFKMEWTAGQYSSVSIQEVVERGDPSYEHQGQLEDMEGEIAALKNTIGLLCSYLPEPQQTEVASLYDFVPHGSGDKADE